MLLGETKLGLEKERRVTERVSQPVDEEVLITVAISTV
jgi:hypothetical protein